MQFTKNNTTPLVISKPSLEEIRLNNNKDSRICICCNTEQSLENFFENTEMQTNREVVCLKCCPKFLIDSDKFNLNKFQEQVKSVNDFVLNDSLTDEYKADIIMTRQDINSVLLDLIKPKRPSKKDVGDGKMYYENGAWRNVDKSMFTKVIEKGNNNEVPNVVARFKSVSINSKLIDGELYFSLKDSYEMLEVSRKSYEECLNNILGDKIFQLGGNPAQLNTTQTLIHRSSA